ncbi:hypothetical protein L211DRAFT_336785 [Terfezia boudieri ATCC MYA-4762]|uniref:Uncharacterized protein n=1 Tax=Terfezia boudieri ATCC MYA-4762 TaxID=1051890 RepID=A0A3N4LHP2_9PEZI|nr:hypothetical protein L211DRAFT_336785 [Terfezia boudieri ATCC MYA-4762]
MSALSSFAPPLSPRTPPISPHSSKQETTYPKATTDIQMLDRLSATGLVSLPSENTTPVPLSSPIHHLPHLMLFHHLY